MGFDALFPIDDPGSRLFHWNITAALSLILLWAIFSFGFGDGLKAVKRLVFNKKYWWNRSSKRDYFFFVTNTLFKLFLFIPFLDFSFHIARFTSSTLVEMSGDFLGLTPQFLAIAAFTVGSFIWDDFLRFFQHLLMHKVPFLWRLHSVHHSAKVLTPITLYRAHPLESAIATLRNSLSLGVSAGAFIFIFEAQLNLWTIAGVNAFGFMFNFLGANLRHSHIPLRFGNFIEKIFISPVQHQIHHSSHKDHFDKNLGVSLAVWDVIAGSWMSSKGLPKLKFGLGHVQSRSLVKEYGLPSIKEIKSYKTRWKSPVDPLPNLVSSMPTLRTGAARHRAF